jgi:hypothetical protein
VRWLFSIHWLGLTRLMARDLARPRAPVDRRGVEALLRKGERAYARGDRRRAHDCWRAAAALAPYVDRIWRARLGVVETEADRRVCWHNIAAINPLNVEAQRALAREDAG